MANFLSGHPEFDLFIPSAVKENSPVLVGPRKAQVLTGVAVAAVLVATLWPLNPRPHNGVTWRAAANGITFHNAGLVVSSGPLKLPQAAQSFTLELLLRPLSVGPSNTILDFCATSCSRQLLVRQWMRGLLVTHNPSVESDPTGTVKLDVGNVFIPGRWVFVALASGSKGTIVYLDGQPAQVFPKFGISRADLSGDFFIGTSATSYQPWSGELASLVVYAKELTAQEVLQDYLRETDGGGHPPAGPDAAIARYAFQEGRGSEVRNEVGSAPSLRIPPSFSVPHKPFLQSPVAEFKSTRSYLSDVATNIAGFVPLGLIVCCCFTWTRRRGVAVLTTIVSCGSLSFAIEVLQYYIPKRGSGITDIITNTLGAALGALLLQSHPLRKHLERIGLIPIAQN